MFGVYLRYGRIFMFTKTVAFLVSTRRTRIFGIWQQLKPGFSVIIMSTLESYSSERLKCPNYFKVHKKSVYKTKTLNFQNVGDYATFLQLKFADESITSISSVCSNCYKRISKAYNNKSKDEDNVNVISNVMAFEVVNGHEDNDFEPDASVCVDEFNETIISKLERPISPLRKKGNLCHSYIKTYVLRKKRQLVSAYSEATSRKLQKIYDVELNEKKNESGHLSKELINNLSKAMDNCSNVSERIKLLTIIAPSLTKFEILSQFPQVTVYMVDNARKIALDKGIYSEPDRYNGHPLDKKTEDIVMQYFLNDDFNCTRQSPNKCDVITVIEDGKKVKKVKRFLTRSMKEVYQVIKDENFEIKISRSKFYSMRPKYVLIDPINDVCLCVYCANFDLFLIGLKNFIGQTSTDLSNVRSEILSYVVCSRPTESCYFQECATCPGAKGITLENLKIDELEASNEICFALWNKGNLETRTVSISTFKEELAKHTVKMISHLRIKEIQRLEIKAEKERVSKNPRHLLMHVDFAENWSVILKNPVQGNHWVNKQVSIFTVVCYVGDMVKSYVVVSDDMKHDYSHALLAMQKIIEMVESILNKELETITILSDGAAGHFKNRFQFYEFKRARVIKKWIFSATGHGKGAVDGVGGLVKHYATVHNLRCSEIDSIQNAESFVHHVQKYTSSIQLILIKSEEIQNFRNNKIEERNVAMKFKGIQQCHMWKSEPSEGENKCYIARTAVHEWIEVKKKEKKVTKRKNKIKKNSSKNGRRNNIRKQKKNNTRKNKSNKT